MVIGYLERLAGTAVPIFNERPKPYSRSDPEFLRRSNSRLGVRDKFLLMGNFSKKREEFYVSSYILPRLGGDPAPEGPLRIARRFQRRVFDDVGRVPKGRLRDGRFAPDLRCVSELFGTR